MSWKDHGRAWVGGALGRLDTRDNVGVFDRNPSASYPGLAALEAHHADVRAECEALLALGERLAPMKGFAGAATVGGIHAESWKVYALYVGDWIEENCARCPRTRELLAGVPELFTAFFSILPPGHVIKPHFGYYAGFLRYHLGVIIPDDNRDQACWLRVNADPAINRARDKSAIADGETYYWRNGEGVLWDDTRLHDARNGSDRHRVILWLDLRRPLPGPVDRLHRGVLWLAARDRLVRGIRNGAVVR